MSNFLCNLFLSAIFFAPPNDGNTGAGSAGNNQAGDQTGAEGGQDKGKPISGDQTGGTHNLSAEQLTAENAKLKADFDHLLQSHTEQKQKWEKREKEEETAKKKALEEQGKYKELYDTAIKENETLKPALARTTEALTIYLAAELAAIPENLKTLIPDGDDVVAKLAAITKIKSAGLLNAQQQKKPGDGSPPAGGDQKPGFQDIYQ